MITSKKILASLAVAGAIIMQPVAAYAHVTVKPAEVVAAKYQVFTTGVPNEKDSAVTGVRLVIPTGVESVTPTVKPGWTVETQKTNDTVTEISWTGGTIDVGMRDEFTFSAQAPAEPTTLTWKAYQSYADGSVVAWNQSPQASSNSHETEDTGPYSETEVLHTAQDDTIATSSEASHDGLYILSGGALLVSLVALAHAVKKK